MLILKITLTGGIMTEKNRPLVNKPKSVSPHVWILGIWTVLTIVAGYIWLAHHIR